MIPNSEWSRQDDLSSKLEKWEVNERFTLHNHTVNATADKSATVVWVQNSFYLTHLRKRREERTYSDSVGKWNKPVHVGTQQSYVAGGSRKLQAARRLRFQSKKRKHQQLKKSNSCRVW